MQRSATHFVREDNEPMKPASNVKTPGQYIASQKSVGGKLIKMTPRDRATTFSIAVAGALAISTAN
jgi:hypothetical protein